MTRGALSCWPVLPVTDACILGAICDVSLLVLRDQKSTRKTAPQARDALLSVGSQLLGAIVNDVPRKKDACSYYYHGDNGIAYGHKMVRDKQEETVSAVPSIQMTA